MESIATVRNIRNSTDSVISHMETVTWLQSCELLFLGRFAEDHYLPGIPLTPVSHHPIYVPFVEANKALARIVCRYMRRVYC